MDRVANNRQSKMQTKTEKVLWFERALNEWVWLYRKLFGTSFFVVVVVTMLQTRKHLFDSCTQDSSRFAFYSSKTREPQQFALNISMIQSSHSQLLSFHKYKRALLCESNSYVRSRTILMRKKCLCLCLWIETNLNWLKSSSVGNFHFLSQWTF